MDILQWTRKDRKRDLQDLQWQIGTQLVPGICVGLLSSIGHVSHIILVYHLSHNFDWRVSMVFLLANIQTVLFCYPLICIRNQILPPINEFNGVKTLNFRSLSLPYTTYYELNVKSKIDIAVKNWLKGEQIQYSGYFFDSFLLSLLCYLFLQQITEKYNIVIKLGSY